MDNLLEIAFYLAGFLIVALAASRIGGLFARVGLPKITGYLFTGLLAGPFFLGLIPEASAQRLLFVDEISLAFIAFAAGSELYLPDLKGRLRSIGWVTAGLVVATLVLTLPAVLLLADRIPFMQALDTPGRVAVALLISAILIARSPSSAIAVVNELRAKGPFTQMALGVTVISDVAVIVVFAISSSAAGALFDAVALNLGFVALLAVELAIAVGAGYIVYRILEWVLNFNVRYYIKVALLLLAGYAVFVLSDALKEYSHHYLPVEIFVEPLLVCLIASFLVNNYSARRLDLVCILHDTGPVIYTLFFTLTGASLQVGLLASTWPIALALFGTRLVAVMAGSFAGGVAAGDPMSDNRLKWMVLVTQAGIALGLAKEVAVEFPQLGNNFATLVISVVVINETFGPLFFKRAINLAGESHKRAEAAMFDGVRDVVIFGQDAQAVVLARQLKTHGWQVKLAWPAGKPTDLLGRNHVETQAFYDLTPDALATLDLSQADAVVTMLSDDENYLVGEWVYENVGAEPLVVLLRDRANVGRFRELGALIVDPSTALVSLLDHVVRAPSAASIFLGLDEKQDIIDLVVRDPSLNNVALRNLRLPLGTIVLMIHRNEQLVMPHGYTRLKMGDRVTIIGTAEDLEKVTVLFDADGPLVAAKA